MSVINDPVFQATTTVACAFVYALVANFQAAIGPDSPYSLGWFYNSISNLSAKYSTPITPAGYTFAIWGLIYTWTAAWIVYLFTTFFRQNSRGPVYQNPPATTVAFLFAFLLNLAANVAWLYVWDRELLTGSCVLMLLVALSSYAALVTSLKSVFEYLKDFEEYANSDLWAYRILIHNGLAIYATWATVATQVNIAVAFIYDAGLDSDTATYTCLSLLAVQLVAYFALDCFVFDAYTRYVFMVYPTAVWALAGIVVVSAGDVNSPEFIYSTTLMALSFVFFVTKTVLMSIRDPILLLLKKAAAATGPMSYSRV